MSSIAALPPGGKAETSPVLPVSHRSTQPSLPSRFRYACPKDFFPQLPILGIFSLRSIIPQIATDSQYRLDRNYWRVAKNRPSVQFITIVPGFGKTSIAIADMP
jgi:hypothetical protein